MAVILIQAFALIQPANSAAGIHSQAILVDSIDTEYGISTGDAAAITTLDQSDTDNDPSRYVSFSAVDTPYYGELLLSVPDDMKAESVTSALLQVNFNGPPHITQTWTWLIQDWATERWHKVGDSIGTQPGEWNTILLRISGMGRYVSPLGKVQIRMASDSKNGSAKVDYLALHITYAPTLPTSTRPTGTALVTKPAYTYAITYTPTLTFTPTNTPTPTFTPTPTATPVCASHDGAFECQVWFLINQERTSRGIPPLTSNLLLHNAAWGHSNDMAQNNFFNHTGSNGSQFYERITAAGYDWSTCGENIAAGYSTPAAVVAGWMASQEGHREAILNVNYVDIGIGYVYKANTKYGHYWTTDFARP